MKLLTAIYKKISPKYTGTKHTGSLLTMLTRRLNRWLASASMVSFLLALKLIVEILFLFVCMVLLIVAAYFIFEFGMKYQTMVKYQENALKQEKRYRDSLAGQVRIINEQDRIIKSICHKPVMQTKSFLNSQHITKEN